MTKFTNRLGIDVGHLYLKLALLDSRNHLLRHFYLNHQGDPKGLLRKILLELAKEYQISAIGITGALSSRVNDGVRAYPVDMVRSQITWVKRKFPSVKNILDLGGGSVSLIELDDRGEFKNFSSNSLCAAGTGSFLDEQATRLEINYQEVSCFPEIQSPPPVAARCSVFAKSDLIHYQQEGYSREELWSGLCRGLCRTVLRTLLKGRTLEGKTVVIGGVSQNREVLKWLKNAFHLDVETFENAHLSAACGSALLAQPTDFIKADWTMLGSSDSTKTIERRARLELKRSIYPSFEVLENYTDELGNEVRVSFLPDAKSFSAFLGIDIGSTSTKLALIDEQARVMIDIYRKTMGEPIHAVQKLFFAVNALLKKHGKEIEILGCGTTGSGRKLVGVVVGADLIVNEITCHYRGARHRDPNVETIFEIGGQDSKYVFLQNGKLRQTNLNYVCAAGTGSFVEELARKMGFTVSEVGNKVLGTEPPYTSDRCTVFMEQDAQRLLTQGFSRQEVMASVLYSVAQNYLSKVVGNRPRSRDRIFFQGATARNPGLVAAFENLLGTQIVVSPYCHILGALGAALLVWERYNKNKQTTKFLGLDLAERSIELRKENCSLCENQCLITYAKVQGTQEEPSFGYLCGRDPQSKKKKRLTGSEFFHERAKLFKTAGQMSLSKPRGKIGILNALTNWAFLPAWKRFFGELGYEVIVSGSTSAELKQKGAEITAGDFCFPVIAAHGHFASLLEKNPDWIILPHFISAEPNAYTTNSFYCPYVQSLPSVLSTYLRSNGRSDSYLLKPVIDFRWSMERQVKELWEKLGEHLLVSRSQIKKAWEAGLAEIAEFELEMTKRGKEILARLEQEDRIGIVILGRPYNVYDPGLNMELTDKIAELGFYVIPVDAIPYQPELLGNEFRNIYWAYGQKILSALKQIRENPRLYPIYFSNFNCGPDSFLIQYAETIMGEKPILALEFDEHGADAGYLTRVEAFLDLVGNLGKFTAAPEIYLPRTKDEDFQKRKLYIPPMHPLMARLGAAALRGFGWKTEVLPGETEESLELGRSVSRGSECLPTAATIGTLLKVIEDRDEDPSRIAFMMASACGPCRFGQYALLHRIILNRKGYKDLWILSPNSANSYQGLGEPIRRRLWDCIVMGDLLFKAGCRLRPYEQNPGEVDKIIESAVQRIERALENNKGYKTEFSNTLKQLASVSVRKEEKPLVGIVGEIYVRANLFCNDQVVRAIEHFGGEAWLAPMSEWFFYTTYLQRWRNQEQFRNFWARGKSILKNRFMAGVEEDYVRIAESVLHHRMEPHIEDVIDAGAKFIPLNFEGEAILTVGRAIKFIEQGAKLVVNCAPFGCMPGTISNAIFQELNKRYQIPLVSIFYDGKPGLNRQLRVIIENLVRA